MKYIMKTYPFDRRLPNESEVLEYYIDAIKYRDGHKDESLEIATHVFDKTHTLQLGFSVDESMDRLRDEFGALEAPGWSKDETKSLEESEEEAWNYVSNLINKVKKSRTV
jgi:hypothetical protein